MKAILITFAVLLLLLTLLSTFGGSIRPAENFYSPSVPEDQEREPQEYFYEDPATEAVPQMPPSEYYENEEPVMPPSEQYTEYAPAFPVSEHFTSSYMELPPVSENYVDDYPKPPVPKQKEQYEDEMMPGPLSEGFAIEPFEDSEKPTFAAF